MGWPNNGANKAPSSSSNLTVRDGDVAYMNALAGKDYIAPASPWFFTHYGPEVSYSKNWVFPAEGQWVQRWQDLLGLGARFVEIVSWNDYGKLLCAAWRMEILIWGRRKSLCGTAVCNTY